MKQSDYNKMVEKAKSKKDGIYSLDKQYYLVIKNKVFAYCDYFGNVCENAFGFSVSKGKAKDRFEGMDVLKKYWKQLKK